MTDIDSLVKDALDRAVPPVSDAEPDWNDVLRRAETRVVALPARRRRTWYALAAAAALTVLLVTPAFGVGPRLLEWFAGSPAPDHVKKNLEIHNESPPIADASGEVVAAFERKGPRVLAQKARGITAIETEDGRVYLYAAPTTSGDWCVYAETPRGNQEPAAASGCPFEERDRDALFTSVSSNDDEDDLRWLLFGRADPPIRSLELQFADGSIDRVPLVRRFFLYEEPPDKEATVLVGRDAAGRIVARKPMPSPALP